MNFRTSIPSFLLLFLLAAIAGAATPESEASGDNWPSFRGPRASGVGDGHPLPTTWSVPEGKNVQWRTEVPGLGLSSPVVWGDRIFLTTAVTGKKKAQLRVGLYGDVTPVYDDTVHRFDVLSFDKRSGEILWQRTAHQGVPKIKRHTKASHANSSPVTDGSHVVVFFGSEGLYSYDFDGGLKWKKDFGVLNSAFFRAPGAQWGFGSSPVIHDGKVIVQCDVTGDSFLAAFDLKDGRELWRTPRDEVPTWSSPTILEHGGRTQIVANGFKHIGGYDFRTGEEIWKLSGGGDIPVPTPVVAHDLVYVTNGHGDGRPIYAIRATASGVISLGRGKTSNQHIAWSEPWGGSYMQTPLVYGDHIYLCRNNGILSCHDARSGERIYRQRLARGNTGFTASAVAGDGKIYYTSEVGEVIVVKAGAEHQVLATNPLDEIAMATPAISEGVLYFRTTEHLIAVAEGDLEADPNPSAE